jgi:hypothetical protein
MLIQVVSGRLAWGLDRAIAVVLLAAFAVAAVPPPARAAGELRLTGKSRIQIVYFGADDCGFCQRWEAPEGARASFRASPLARQVEFYEARRRTLAASPSIADVPTPAKWIWERAWIPRGTPAWLVAVDNTVVLTLVGLEHWESNVLPVVERLVASRARLRQ